MTHPVLFQSYPVRPRCGLVLSAAAEGVDRLKRVIILEDDVRSASHCNRRDEEGLLHCKGLGYKWIYKNKCTL